MFTHIAMWDRVIQNQVITNYQPELISFFAAMTTWGNSATLILLCALASAWLVLRERCRTALILDLGLTAAWLSMALLKLIFARLRPLGEHLVYAGGYSLPSGHAMLSLVFYGFLGYILSSRLTGWSRWAVRIGAASIIILIGMSRVYLNVHYASDVIAGFFFGGLFLALMIWGHRRLGKSGDL